MTDLLAETEIQPLPLDKLDLDKDNPRLLRVEPAGTELTEVEMVEALLDAFDPEPVGRSIVEYGFFATEPLIVFAKGDRYVVAEGNRRLVALKLLLDPGLREAVEADNVWAESAAELDQNQDRRERLQLVPCQIVPDRASAAPVIGYRHIVGILKWEAFEKAAFVVKLVRDDPTRSFDDVADLTGERPQRIRRYLRDFLAIEQAKSNGVDAARAAQQFGRWERAMNTRGVRQYIEARSPRDMSTSADRAYDADDGQMRKLLSFLYGEPGGPERLFSDTRRIDELAAALESEDGRRILEDDRDLDRAFEAAGGRKDYVVKSLGKALTGLQQAAVDYADYVDDEEVAQLTAAIEREFGRLREGVGISNEARAEGLEDFELEDDEEGEDDDSEEDGQE
jgi:hypothetical protein